MKTSFTAPLEGPPVAESDLTYRPAYQQLAEEVEKGRSLAGGTTDWRWVAGEGTRILREEAKDLRAASWVVVALANLEGWPGAAEGLEAYGALLEQFWDSMVPSRPRARATLADWVWEGLTRALRTRALRLEDREAIAVSRGGAARVDQILSERLKLQSEGAGGFRKLVRETLASLPESPPPGPVVEDRPEPASAKDENRTEEPMAAAPAPDRASPLSLVAPVPVAPTSLDEAERSATELRDPLGALARYVREVAPASPWSYRLGRTSAWLTIEEPPYVERGRTSLRAPAASDRDLLERLAGDGAWAELRDASEAALSEHIFWLDLHRYTALALERLGASFGAAREVVVREALGFLERVPGLEPLAFSNGTPLADPETVSWLDRERAARGNGREQGHEGHGDASFAELLSTARSRLGTDTEAALAEVLSAAQALRTTPARFLANLGAARLALEAGKRETALVLYERLYAQVDGTLESWAPAVCRDYFDGYLGALGVVDADSPLRRRRAALFRRLLAIDPGRAFRH
ncbi:MAG TPA: type VI secretion system protein TssA, partial [Polyangiaceae bacterium]